MSEFRYIYIKYFFLNLDDKNNKVKTKTILNKKGEVFIL